MTEIVSDAPTQVLSERMDAPVGDAPLPCPLCGYDLRGQSEPRCSECGYRFEWSEILDPTKRIHPFLFEDHPERNFKSFRQTVAGGWRPKRFWTGILPSQQPNHRRLMIYGCVLFSSTVGVIPVAIVREGFATAMEMSANRRQFVQKFNYYASSANPPLWIKNHVSTYGSPQAALDAMVPEPTLQSVWQYLSQNGFALTGMIRELLELGLVCALIGIWPLLTAVALHVFQWSMRKVSIHTVHVFRCTIYCGDVAIMWSFCIIAIAATHLTGSFMQRPLSKLVWYSAVLAWWIASYRLARAYQFYLRFDRPWATVMASQIIVFLVYAIVIALFVAITFTPLSIL